jgi:hypothetical protein
MTIESPGIEGCDGQPHRMVHGLGMGLAEGKLLMGSVE